MPSLPPSNVAARSKRQRPSTRSSLLTAPRESSGPTDGGIPDPISPSIPTAARRLYDTLDVRHVILSLLDFGDWARMLRVEKAITASVAGLLYREVTASQTAKMSRASVSLPLSVSVIIRVDTLKGEERDNLQYRADNQPRRAVYCDAVRILDRNPPPPLTLRSCGRDTPRPTDAPIPTPFHPELFLKNLATWRRKFPNLTSVNYLYPSNPADDAYSVDIDPTGKVTLHLETRVNFDILTAPRSEPHLPPLPAAPAVEGVIVHHTLAIKLIGERYGPYSHSWGDDELLNELAKWQQWLYSDPLLDRWVTSIEPHRLMAVPLYDTITLLVGRYRAEPHTSLVVNLPIPVPESPPTRLFLCLAHVIGQFMGSSLRSLSVSLDTLRVLEDEPQIALHLLSRELPCIEQLTILGSFTNKFDLSRAMPLEGMPKLRLLSLKYQYDYRDWDWTVPLPKSSIDELAAYICRLGRRDCVYRLDHPDLHSGMAMERFNAQVRKLKTSCLADDGVAGPVLAEELVDKWDRAMVVSLQWRDDADRAIAESAWEGLMV